jgi:hypothetical protein
MQQQGCSLTRYLASSNMCPLPTPPGYTDWGRPAGQDDSSPQSAFNEGFADGNRQYGSQARRASQR